MSPEAARFRGLIARFPSVRAAVIGDLVADEFIYGRIERVSREAPVLILSYNSTAVIPGGAGNAANNAAALGARVSLSGIVGRDSAGDWLLDALRPRVNVSRVQRVPTYVTPVKTRILAGGVHSAKQQVVRIDRAGTAIPAAAAHRLEQDLARALRSAQVVIISDYGSGLITPAVWRRARAASAAGRPIVVLDSRYALASFSRVTACTPNESEV